MTEAEWFWPLLERASEGHLKRIACHVWPNMEPDDALSQLRKAFRESVMARRLVEGVFLHGNRDVLRTGIDERLRDVSLTQLADDVHRVQVQLELFLPTVRTLVRRVDEFAEVLPQRRKPGG